MTTKTLLEIVLSFGLSTLLCPLMIPLLKKIRFGQYIREEGPREHYKKSGTPTMGGVVILAASVLPSLLFVRESPEITPILFLMAGFALVGFLDDYLKVANKRNLGLKSWQKLVLQGLVTGVFALYLLKQTESAAVIRIPFLGELFGLKLPEYFGLIFFAVLGTANGVNLTDGLDGLAASVTAMIAVFFAFVSAAEGGGIETVAGAVAGSLMGFLLFNAYPARVFMGDTGSLALGGFVAGAACVLHLELILPVVGFIYVMEVVSVILQVGYFKLTHGKRIFKMAPFHHHLELCGWSESRIVAVFSIITALLCLIAYKII
ncbi:MAG: phospho-N-acetylmuramoyl-pentapeptide-transferase [Lachnospiraceae bacterium]|nr:phospho-N-acetylmuramoyl-pentapeptide-transferase [Lachnospiraceae bacterium]